MVGGEHVIADVPHFSNVHGPNCEAESGAKFTDVEEHQSLRRRP